MNQGILAVTVDGRLTYCKASEDQRGKGRCNHLFHKRKDQSPEEFINFMEQFNFVKSNNLIPVNTIDADFVIGGTQTKWWSRDRKTLYKLDVNNKKDEMVQWNGLSEEIVSQFLNSNFISCNGHKIPCAKYRSTFIDGKVGVETDNFIGDCKSLVEFGELLTNEDLECLTDIENEDFEAKFNHLRGKIKDKTGYDASDDIIRMMKIDIITMNADRHYGNIGLIIDEFDRSDVKFAPLYDNGQCLLSEDIYLNTEAYGYDKFDLPGLSMFGMFPMKNYIKFVMKHSNKNNNIQVDLDRAEKFIELYENQYYSSEKVEKVKWLLWDNLDLYSELGVINNDED